MAVGASDFAVLIVDAELGALIAADDPTELFGLGLSVSNVTCSLATVALDLPTAILVRHDAVGISCHVLSS